MPQNAFAPLPQPEESKPATTSYDHNDHPLVAVASADTVTTSVATPTAAEPIPNPNVLETISIIMDRPGGLEDQSLNKQLQEASKPTNVNAAKANTDWKTQSLPILDNLVCIL